MRLLKKDLLRLKYNNSDTYWIEKMKKSTVKISSIMSFIKNFGNF